ncbi:FAD:protein FMN transferase [Cucumibacter marinus]|uniref:FAD:protein FMN transferase n=1 Tax=Cucumibacter marinus TaxID=1121252 RepID=UPI00041B39BD|nr:FAD:protein FMN transferase [Cucumibacter marinus]
MFTRRTFLALSGAAALSPSPGHASNAISVLGGNAFGTYWRLALPMGTEIDVSGLRAIISQVDAGFSPFRSDSELSSFNRADTSDWVPVSADLTTVLGKGLEIAAASGGAFDPTIGPLVHRFGFGPIRAGAWGAFEQIDIAAGTVRKADARLSLDLCGIAKGHAVDRMVADLEKQGISDFLLDLGGELRASGRHPDGRDWQVAVESLAGQFPLVVRLDRKAIATSGISAQSYGRNGNMVSHIVDPHTGSPAGGKMVTVSVLADDATIADGWATALMAMPPEAAFETAEAIGLDALLFMRDGTVLRPVMTGRFAESVLG